MKKRSYKGAPDIILPLIDALGEIPVDDLIFNTAEALRQVVIGKTYNLSGHARLSVKRLIASGVIRKRMRHGKIVCELTEKGKDKLRRSNLHSALSQNRSWDGKWRMIIFDIAETSRRQRDLLRNELQYQGFKKVQNSVWIYPHECFEFVGLLKTSFKLGNSVLYATVQELEDDEKLKKEFGLN